jgi:hypothetical protein
MIKCRAVPVCTRHAGLDLLFCRLDACLMVKHGKIFLKLVKLKYLQRVHTGHEETDRVERAWSWQRRAGSTRFGQQFAAFKFNCTCCSLCIPQTPSKVRNGHS